MSDTFDAALPPPYSGKWKQAERASPEDSPRVTSYEAPGGEAVSFILKSFKFSGGQSMDTSEYPFGGLWSNEALNEKPQELHIEGFIRGNEYIQSRNALVEALRVTTDDSTPGFIDFPFWGRFPIVVIDYEISENTDEKGQCAITLSFKRAGVSVSERENALAEIAGMNSALEEAARELENASIHSFEKTLEENADANTDAILSQGFTQIKTALLTTLGRIRAAETTLNTISSEINGITGLVSETIRAPGQLARAAFNAAASIVAGLAEIKNSVSSYLPKAGTSSSYTANPGAPSNSSSLSRSGSVSTSSYPMPVYNNEHTVLLQFLSAHDFRLGGVPLTVRQEAAQKAVGNLFRITAFTAAAKLLSELDASFQKTDGLWKLFQKLEAGIDKNDPAVYAALTAVRVYTSRILSAKELSAEKTRHFDIPLPLLLLAHTLGCAEEKIRELNRVADSFVIKGGVLYV